MELQSVRIVNFRPFREIEADFTGTDGHIHLIEGPQGAGKTSFHRAVQWGLFGGKGPTHNYRTNWNASARSEEDETMEVHLKYREAGRSYVIVRQVERFNHNLERAREKLTIYLGEEMLDGEEAQDFIHARLPEDLRGFFFLDGEEIQNLIGEEAGDAVKREIETVLKHQAIINADKDLGSLVDSRYAPDRNKMEKERRERDEIIEEISELREEKSDLEARKRELTEERTQRKEEHERTLKLLEEYDEEAMKRLSSLDDDIHEVTKQRNRRLQDLREAWERLPIAILSPQIEEAVQNLARQEQECDRLAREIERHEIVAGLVEEARQGPCPICGREDGHATGDHDLGQRPEGSREELSARAVECRKLRVRLESAPRPASSPSEIESDIHDLDARAEELQGDRQHLLGEFGGKMEDSEKDQLQKNLRELERRIDQIDDAVERLSTQIRETKDEIRKKQNEREKRAGSRELELLYDKIEAAEDVQAALRRVRERHIQLKREKIKEEMNQVFDRVSQSEFIRGRYKGIAFKGEAEDEDEYVLQLIHRDGSRKNMEDHPPSAGETQLTALSFIFGLNKYAKYSTTIVFDTVAGRLDLANSQAQGDFFTSLTEPIVLLVTDAELQVLGAAMRESAGVHYRLVPDNDMNSTLKEVERR